MWGLVAGAAIGATCGALVLVPWAPFALPVGALYGLGIGAVAGIAVGTPASILLATLLGVRRSPADDVDAVTSLVGWYLQGIVVVLDVVAIFAILVTTSKFRSNGIAGQLTAMAFVIIGVLDVVALRVLRRAAAALVQSWVRPWGWVSTDTPIDPELAFRARLSGIRQGVCGIGRDSPD